MGDTQRQNWSFKEVVYFFFFFFFFFCWKSVLYIKSLVKKWFRTPTSTPSSAKDRRMKSMGGREVGVKEITRKSK